MTEMDMVTYHVLCALCWSVENVDELLAESQSRDVPLRESGNLWGASVTGRKAKRGEKMIWKRAWYYSLPALLSLSLSLSLPLGSCCGQRASKHWYQGSRRGRDTDEVSPAGEETLHSLPQQRLLHPRAQHDLA